MKIKLMLTIAMTYATIGISASEISLKIQKNYLNLPISEQGEQKEMKLFTGKGKNKKEITRCKIRLNAVHPDYWMFYDVSAYKGKTIDINFEGEEQQLTGIQQADSIIGENKIYKEAFRQQFHYSTKRGWVNDPNGMVYYDGEYHLFYQLNPYDVNWGNLNWGHAVSRDLVHWEELPVAIQADEYGEIYSGSAIVDYKNTTGLGKKNNPAMLAFYTVQCRDGQTQCLAYSLDHGRTWTKYAGNPIIDTRMKNQSWHNRDPKVFWYEKGQHWVMVVFEKDGQSIYNSNDLLHWTYESHTTGMWECPELYELPVDGDMNNKKWVLTSASGVYMIGSFDGKKFTPESGKHYSTTGYFYAAQTFNGIPEKDGRRIQIAWASIRKDKMPFTGFFLLPTEQSLRTTSQGIRLVSQPVKETEQLFDPIFNTNKTQSMNEANATLAKMQLPTDGMRIKAKMRFAHTREAGIMLDGQKILDYDMIFSRVNGTFYCPDDMTSTELTVDMYIDRSSVECYVDGGLYSFVIERKAEGNDKGLKFWSLEDMNLDQVENLEVYSAKSIWKK